MRTLTSLVLALSLAACGGSKSNTSSPEPRTPVVDRGAPVVEGGFPGYYPVGNKPGEAITTNAGSQTVQLAVVLAKDGSARKLVWIDPGGRWTEIASLPATVAVSPDAPGPDCATANGSACETVAVTSFNLDSPSNVLTLRGFASGNTADYWITWLPRWDASRNNFIVDKPSIQRTGKPQPSTSAAPANTAPNLGAPDPTVEWKPSTNSEDAGAYVTSGLPAISADGTAVLFAVQGADDARGTPHLELVTTDLHNVVLDSFVLPKLRRDTPRARAAPTAAALRAAADFLKASNAKHSWHPLHWQDVAVRDGAVVVDGFEIASVGSDQIVRISKNKSVILDKIDLARDVATTHVASKAPQPGCGKEPHVSGIAIDEAHSVALIRSTLLARDGCFPDPVFAVHSWAKR
ncbi:MAG: hypothetical protein JWO36_405 [Myxococcales bacterium]|nr:hypothetical protein [Myxococcales bacterium]